MIFIFTADSGKCQLVSEFWHGTDDSYIINLCLRFLGKRDCSWLPFAHFYIKLIEKRAAWLVYHDIYICWSFWKMPISLRKFGHGKDDSFIIVNVCLNFLERLIVVFFWSFLYKSSVHKKFLHQNFSAFLLLSQC